jgi:riboflavin synthase
MFTGLIETVGRLAGLEPRGENVRLIVDGGHWNAPLVLGESIAVNGVCLTVAEFDGARFAADLLDTTLMRTGLGGKPLGSLLNLERALRVGDRLGGHFVTGHVDGTGTIEAIQPAGPDWMIRVRATAELLRGMPPRGSVALDGISLTLAETGSDFFEVHLIPHTLRNTALSAARPGDWVNLETDLIGKYVAHLLGDVSGKSSLTVESLRQAGFAVNGVAE